MIKLTNFSFEFTCKSSNSWFS